MERKRYKFEEFGKDIIDTYSCETLDVQTFKEMSEGLLRGGASLVYSPQVNMVLVISGGDRKCYVLKEGNIIEEITFDEFINMACREKV